MTALDAAFLRTYGPWAVVTGASAGIGREFARLVASKGLSVVLVARRRAPLEATADELRRTCHVSVRVVPADLSAPSGVAAVVDSTCDLQVGLLIANAGMATYGSFFSADANAHASVLALNAGAPVALARAFGAPMRDRRRGGLLLVGSQASALVPYFATYAASKAALAAFSRLLAFELRPFNVAVTCVQPGLVDTRMARLMLADIDLTGLPCASPATVARDALKHLGTAPVYTPGARARVVRAAASLLPERLRFALVGRQIRAAMSPALRKQLDPPNVDIREHTLEPVAQPLC